MGDLAAKAVALLEVAVTVACAGSIAAGSIAFGRLLDVSPACQLALAAVSLLWMLGRIDGGERGQESHAPLPDEVPSFSKPSGQPLRLRTLLLRRKWLVREEVD
jgi:hypothetical protein